MSRQREATWATATDSARRFNMATAVWKGLLRFGLLALSVKLYRAAQAEKISFRQLQKTTGARVRHTLCADVVHADTAITSKDPPAESPFAKTRANDPSTVPAVKCAS